VSVDVSSILVKRASVSLIWSRNLGDTRELDPEKAYKTAWKGACKKDASFTVPWTQAEFMSDGRIRPGSRDRFWLYYLESKNKGHDLVTCEQAYRHFVPFRYASPLAKLASTTQRSDERLETGFEGFWFPTSVAVVATVRFRSEKGMPLDVLVPRLSTWRRSEIDDVATGALRCLQEKIRDSKKTTSLPGDLPASIATVIDADGSASEEVENRTPLHLALDGLCSFDRRWSLNGKPLADLSERTLLRPGGGAPLHLRPQGEIGAVYAPTPRARVVWAPRLFSVPKNALGWYHRNLVLTMMQTEALIQQLVRPLGIQDDLLKRWALGQLTRLHEGVSTYRSASAVVRINDVREKLNEHRRGQHFGFTAKDEAKVELKSRFE